MPRLASRLASLFCIFAMVVASASVTAAVILWPQGVATAGAEL
jgi:hypothetical protein